MAMLFQRDGLLQAPGAVGQGGTGKDEQPLTPCVLSILILSLAQVKFILILSGFCAQPAICHPFILARLGHLSGTLS